MSRGLLPALSPVLLSAFFLIFSPSSHAVYKCTQQGTISYSDQPCSGSQLELAAPPPARPPDRATELPREKADVARMQNARELMERQDQTFRTMSLRGEAAKKKKCNALALQRKWKEGGSHKSENGLDLSIFEGYSHFYSIPDVDMTNKNEIAFKSIKEYFQHVICTQSNICEQV